MVKIRNVEVPRTSATEAEMFATPSGLPRSAETTSGAMRMNGMSSSARKNHTAFVPKLERLTRSPPKSLGLDVLNARSVLMRPPIPQAPGAIRWSAANLRTRLERRVSFDPLGENFRHGRPTKAGRARSPEPRPEEHVLDLRSA